MTRTSFSSGVKFESIVGYSRAVRVRGQRVEVSGLISPDMLVEIEADAVTQ